MFFVDKIKQSYRREFFVIHSVPTLLVFFAFSGVTFLSWQQANDRARADRQEALSSNVNEVSNTLSGRISTYEEVLRAGASLFKSSEEVTREEWGDFANLFDLENRYPGIFTIVYAEAIPRSNLPAHEARVRGESNATRNYRVFPEGDREHYVSILYREPQGNGVDLRVVGFDLYSNEIRRRAIDTAIKTNEPAITEVFYPREDFEKENPSMAIFFPIVIDDNAPAGIDNVSGVIEVVIRTNSLFSGLNSQEDNFGYRIFTSGSAQSPLYQTSNFASLSSEVNQKQTREVPITRDTSWTIEATSNDLVGTPAIQERPAYVLVSGILISLFMASFVYVVLASRTRALRFKEESEIQSAKDELLALASHQLRTPATGVKQYVSMLMQGYAGELTAQQQKLLGKAYEGNERQLTTINEMLSVARADTGRLSIEKAETDLREIVRDVIDEQIRGFEKRKQKITVRLPNHPTYARVDAQYFRMALENIINNASKYTPEKGAVDVSLKHNKNELVIAVDDTGVGIPARHFPMLFKKFSRIPNELSNQVSGTGIGLYLAKYIVEAHGGRLTFSSDPGVGSSFKIHLPIK